ISVRQALKTVGAMIFLLLCCSTGALAQSPSETQELGHDKQTINFKRLSVKTAINAVGKQLNLKVVYDDMVKDSDKLTLELEDVSLEQALKIFLVAKRLQARILEENTIIVFPDNEANVQRYGQYELWPAKSGGSN